jgi:hypothetical protein
MKEFMKEEESINKRPGLWKSQKLKSNKPQAPKSEQPQSTQPRPKKTKKVWKVKDVQPSVSASPRPDASSTS